MRLKERKMGWRTSAENWKFTGSRSLKPNCTARSDFWTGRSDFVSVETKGGCESAGVWIFWSERDDRKTVIL